jgi:hypothetical protein
MANQAQLDVKVKVDACPPANCPFVQFSKGAPDGTFNGNQHLSGLGSHDEIADTEYNDAFEFLQLPAGLKVTLFEHHEYAGKSLALQGPLFMYSLPNEWKNAVTSYKVEQVETMGLADDVSPPVTMWGKNKKCK